MAAAEDVNSQQKRNVTSALQTAIANLECFASKNEAAPIANVSDLAVKQGRLIEETPSPLSKTISMTCCLLASFFSTHTLKKMLKNKVDVQDAVTQAIDVIKRNHLVLEKLQTGSPEERQLATAAFAVIRRYNALFEVPNSRDWQQRIFSFFYKMSGLSVDDDLKANRIDLPVLHKVQIGNAAGISSQKISLAFQSHLPMQSADSITGFSAVTLTKVIADPLSKQETDLLRMKANTIIKQHGIKFSSMTEALYAIKEAPIETFVNEENSIASLRLSLMLIPGLTVDIEGSFKRSNQQHSIPLSDEFRLSYSALPNGFPHPLQYTGWALENALIPVYPHRLDQMPLFKTLYARKQETAAALLPDGAWFAKARSLWTHKSAFFKTHAEKLLELHERLSLTIMYAAPLNILPATAEETIKNFFQHLRHLPDAIEQLAKAYGVVNTYFIKRQHEGLQDVWMQRADSEPEHVLQAAAQMLAKDRQNVLRLLAKKLEAASTVTDKHILEFGMCFGTMVHMPAQSLLMQYYSETFGSAPRMLTDFEQKLQIAAYKQQYLFLEELANSDLLTPHAIFDAIESDIALFENDASDAPDADYVNITHELEVYFNSRYYSSK